MEPPPRILIVDDEPALRNAIKAQLQRAIPSARILMTASPEDALRLVESGGVDMVVSDHHMPQGDGRLLLARIAEIRPSTLRVLLTADADLEANERDVASGAYHAALQKSAAGDELVRTLARLLNASAIAPRPGGGPGPRAGHAIERAAVQERAGSDGPPRKRLLVVDDVLQLCQVIQSIALRIVPAPEVITETAPSAAVQRISREFFDVILSDYRMPGINGVELLARARLNQPTARRILVTGYNEISETPEGLTAASIDAYAHKPVATQDMLLLLRDALSDDAMAMDNRRGQARIIEREALRKSSAIELDDS